MYQVILFDLDGTLTDSAQGIIRSVQYAIEKMGREVPPENELRRFLGPPLKEEFMGYLGLSEEEARYAVDVYRERYNLIGIFENAPYEGICQVLEGLKERGYRLGVASSKPEKYVLQILEHFHMDSYFDAIVGSNMDGTRTRKADVVWEALTRLGVQERRRDVILVGDRKYDVLGARAMGIDCLAVSYGYGSLEELNQAGPTAIVSSMRELDAFFSQTQKRQDTWPMRIWRLLYPVAIHWSLMQAAAVILMYVLLAMGVLSKRMTGTLSLVATAVGGGLMIPICLYFIKRDRLQRPAARHALKKMSMQNSVWMLVFGACLSYVVNLLVSLSGLPKLFPEYSEISESTFSGQSFLLLLLCVAIIGPVAEEFIFRGLVFKRAEDYWGTTIAMVVSSVAFGVYHGNMVQLVYACILGMFMAWTMKVFDSLVAPVMLHIGANFWSVLLMKANEWFSTDVLVIPILGILVLQIIVIVVSISKLNHIQNVEISHS